MVITFPSNTREIINQIRTAIGRDVFFYIVDTVTQCPICDLDPITNTSTDSFCTTCSGEYWIKTYTGIPVSGFISWQPSDILNWQSAGQLFDGDCRVQIERTDYNLQLVELTKFVVVDNKVMEIRKVTPRGVKELNRLLIDLIEKEKSND
jgi:hypothetical protein